MTEQLLVFIVAWLETPMGVTVAGAIITFLVVSIIKWAATSVRSFLTGIPGRFERWLTHPQSMP